MIPSKLRYGNKVEAAAAKSFKSNVQPQNGTGPYGLGNLININIPTRNNLLLAGTESYLKFDFALTNSTGGALSARWDSCGAHGLIQRIRVYHGSNLLEDIDNYGLLAKMLFDIQMHTDACYGKYNIMAGTRNDLYVATGGNAATQVNSGELICQTIATGSTSVKRTYCLNLISIVGSLCGEKYFPLFACTSAPLRVEIQLVDSIVKAVGAKGANAVDSSNVTFAMNNVEYVANNIELSDQAMGTVIGALNGQPLQFVIPQYRNYAWVSQALTGATVQLNMPIPAKFTSLKSIFVCIRDKQTGANAYFPFSCTTCGTFQDYYFRIGPSTMPAKAPASTVETFSELMKAIGSISDLNNTPSIEMTSYTMTASSALDHTVDAPLAQYNSGSFYVGLDLENYVGANKDSIFAGWNSSTDDIFFVYDVVGTLNATPRFDSFAMFDCLVVFENGTAYTKF